MFKPLPIFIASRYTAARRGGTFISLISLMAVMGIALGVTVLITVLSVLNGFDREIKKSIFSMMAPITITSLDGHIDDWRSINQKLLQTQSIQAVSPFISGQAIIQSADVSKPIVLVGVLPALEEKTIGIDSKMQTGKFANLLPYRYGIVLPKELALRLKVNVGDAVSLLTPQKNFSAKNIRTNLRKFKVAGIYQAGSSGGASYEANIAYIHLNDAQQIYSMGNRVTALQANIADIYQANDVSRVLRASLPPHLLVSDWTDQLGAFFENIQLTKTIMFFIFILIIIVAAFNLVGTLIMVVDNKRAEIAILRTMGATPGLIMTIFIVQGTLIGFFGVLLGIICGSLLSYNVTHIVDAIQHVFNIQLISANIYFVDFLPSELHWTDVRNISCVTLALCMLATLRPALRAARMLPAEMLRDE